MQTLKILYMDNNASSQEYPDFLSWPESWQIKHESFKNLEHMQSIDFDALVAYVKNQETVELLLRKIEQPAFPPCYVIIDSASPAQVSSWIKAGIEYVLQPESAKKILINSISQGQDKPPSVRESQNPTQQLQSLNRIASLFAKMQKESELLDQIPQLLLESLEFDQTVVVLINDGKFEVRAAHVEERVDTVLRDMVEKMNQGTLDPLPQVKALIKDQKSIYIKDVHLKDLPISSIIATPIIVQEKTVGFIEVDMIRHSREVDERDVARLEMFAKMIGFALENIRTYANLEKLVKERTESLTQANERLGEKAKELSNAAYELANANIQMLAVQEELEEKNKTAKRLLEEKSKSKQELQATLDASTNVIMMVNEKGRITATNRNLHKFFGLYKKDVIHKSFAHFRDLIAPMFEGRNAFENMVQELIIHADEPELQDPTLEVFQARALKLLHPREKYIALFSTPVRKSSSNSRVWTMIDITKLKIADEQLHAIVRVSPIPYIITRTSDDTILYVNEPLASLIGINAREMIGKTTPDFIAEPEKRKYILEQVKKYGELQNYELEIKRYDGSTIWMIASLVQTEIDDEKVLIGALYNINERRRAEEALRRERNFVSGILDTSGALILVLDPEGRIVRFNRACETLTGYAFETVRGKRVWDLFIHVNERDRIKQSLTGLRKSHPSTQSEYSWMTRDKEERLITWSNTALFDDQGNLEFIISTGIDITDRIGAEKKLAERLRYEEGLALCVQELLTGQEMHTALSAALYHLQIASQATRAYIFENKIDQNGDLYLHQVVHSHETPLTQLPNSIYKKVLPRWQRLMSNNKPIAGPVKDFPEKERVLLQKENISSILLLPIFVESHWHGFIGFDEIEAERIWNDQDIRLLNTAAEMIGGFLAKAQADKALEMSEKRFRSLVENAHDIIYSTDASGKFTYLSPQFEQYTGYPSQEFLGKSFAPLMHLDDSATNVKSPVPPNDTEFRLKKRDKGWCWFVTHATSIKDENGNLIESIGIAHDVTDLKRVMDNLEQINQELLQTQAQLVQSEKMAALGSLVAGVAHEVNNPLGAVNSAADVISRCLIRAENLPDLAHHCKEMQDYDQLLNLLSIMDKNNKIIVSAGKRVAKIVKSLKNFARLDESDFQKANILDGLDNTLTLLHHEMKNKIEVVKKYKDIPQIHCYPNQLNQVFMNILVNAIQAIPDKGQIEIKTQNLKKRIKISISDTGKGIDPRHLSRIFDPGFTTKGVGVGTGLGLSICYQIVQDHNGELKVDSKPGQGTTFTIYLPKNLKRQTLTPEYVKKS
ncbi:PAS domain S-box protein [candidate division KSB1 bacterium]|nr:PAS domain S-box protein [candidate division KSB1 bacterium]